MLLLMLKVSGINDARVTLLAKFETHEIDRVTEIADAKRSQFKVDKIL